MALTDGQLFAGYTIRGRLGAGGMGEVYLAAHPRLPRPEALKVLPRSASADPDYRKRFHREAELAATLFHPNIVGIHDRGEFDGQLWISMDYVAGTDANRLVKDRYRSGLPAALALDLITAVASALDYAHQRGLLHRDVKPANVLIADPETPSQRIFLTDFGIARHIADGTSLTPASQMIGTMSYSSPEQLSGGHLDGRSDQYGLACTAYFLLTGAPPFVGAQAVDTVNQHLHAPPPSLGLRRPDLISLDPVFARALAKDPGARYPTCAEFANALRNAPTAAEEITRVTRPPIHRGAAYPVAPQHVPPRPPVPPGPPYFGPPPGPPPPPRKPQRGLLIGGAVAGVVVLIAAIVAVVLVSGGDSDSTATTSTMVDAPGRTTAKSSSKSSTPRSSTRRSPTPTPNDRSRPPVTFNFDGKARAIDNQVICSPIDADLSVIIGTGDTVVLRLTRGPDPTVVLVALGTIDGVGWTNTADSGRGKMVAVSDDGKNWGVVGDVFGVDGTTVLEKYFELGFTCP